MLFRRFRNRFLWDVLVGASILLRLPDWDCSRVDSKQTKLTAILRLALFYNLDIGAVF